MDQAQMGREPDDQIADLSDDDVVAIWLNAPDPEHPTPRELAALAAMEARNLDF
tara:strand:+ start:5625 stop:5786 length:162 start_codon:yes stop_codon:yes gene_type:complete